MYVLLSTLDSLQFLFEQLLLIQLGIVAAALAQFVVRSDLDDCAAAKNHDSVSILDGRYAMRNQNRGPIPHYAGQAVQDLLLCDRIDARERVVENEDAGVSEYSARNG